MSDDLVKRLRVHVMRTDYLSSAAADRIEEMEAEISAVKESLTDAQAKLAKAVEALGRIADDCAADYPPSHGAIKHDASTTLAELKGDKQ